VFLLVLVEKWETPFINISMIEYLRGFFVVCEVNDLRRIIEWKDRIRVERPLPRRHVITPLKDVLLQNIDGDARVLDETCLIRHVPTEHENINGVTESLVNLPEVLRGHKHTYISLPRLQDEVCNDFVLLHHARTTIKPDVRFINEDDGILQSLLLFHEHVKDALRELRVRKLEFDIRVDCVPLLVVLVALVDCA
jgi:hypothetical protein